MCVNTFHTYWRYYYTGDKTRNDREMKFYTKKKKKKKKKKYTCVCVCKYIHIYFPVEPLVHYLWIVLFMWRMYYWLKIGHDSKVAPFLLNAFLNLRNGSWALKPNVLNF